MRGSPLWACLAAAALAAGAPAQTYTIKLKQSADVGKSVLVKNTDSREVTTKVTDDNGNTLEKEKKETEKDEEVYTETVLERGGERPRKVKRAYEKATRTRQGKAEARSYQGRTVLIEEKGGKYAVSVEGDKPLSKEDLEDLTRKENEPTQEQVFLPQKPLKVGDSWKIETKDLIKAYATHGKLDAEHTSAEAKLTKAYKKGDQQFGVIVMTVKLSLAEAPPDVKFDAPPVVEMTITLDTAIDGSSTAGLMTMTGKSVSKGTIDQMGIKIHFDSKVDLSGKQEQSVEK